MDISSLNFFAILVGVLSVTISILLLYAKNLNERRYDLKNRNAELSEMRAYFEKQMIALNQRLVTTEERWKDVNHLLITSSKSTDNENLTGKVRLSQFLKSFGIREDDLELEKDLVFVLTPFHPSFNDTYQTIQTVCLQVGLRCLRGDEQFNQGDILPFILNKMVKARLIIANIESRNPNVFYELGIANAIDKPVIMITSQNPDKSIDIKSRKLIIFENQSELREKLQTELTRAFVSF